MSFTKLKPHHQRFVDAYIETGKGSAAYRKAGYKVGNNHSVAVNASRLLTNADIQAAIAQRQLQLINERELSLREKKAVLTEIALFGSMPVDIAHDIRMADPGSSIRAIAELNRMDGHYKSGKLDGTSPVSFVQELDTTIH